ncbi:hypothetical protein Bbelb_365750 [Branchiostoma belcheri]|nr:hypothetical protein Bbelb_365750 [Branchiostoma belcheri]
MNNKKYLLYAPHVKSISRIRERSRTGATPMRQPEPCWQPSADAAAAMLNPMYASNAGTTPMLQPQSKRSRGDNAAKIPNPMYASNAGATRMRQPLSYLQSLANAASKMFNPMYAFSSADPPMDQPKTDNQARANDAENTPEVTYATIPGMRNVHRHFSDLHLCPHSRTLKTCLPQMALLCYPGAHDPPMDQPQTDNPSRANGDENTPGAENVSIPVDPPMDQPQSNYQARANNIENTPDDTQATISGGATGRRGVCSFLRAHRSWLAAGIAVLLSLCTVGLAPLTFSNKQEISQLSKTVKRDLRQLAIIVDALKCDQDNKHQLVTTVDALKRDQDGMSTTVDALKRNQDDMSTTVDDLKRDLDNERNGMATLQQRLHVIEKILRYTMWRGTCYKAFDTRKTFSNATAACRADGGTLAMPRDAETNAFLISLYRSVRAKRHFWFGLHDQREEGKFEWVDGSALGPYSSWGPGEPDSRLGQDCVLYATSPKAYTDKWNDFECHDPYRFICQAAPDLADTDGVRQASVRVNDVVHHVAIQDGGRQASVRRVDCDSVVITSGRKSRDDNRDSMTMTLLQTDPGRGCPSTGWYCETLRRDLIVRTPRGTPPVAGIPPGHISYVTDQMNRIKPMPARLLSPTGASRGYIPDGHRRNWDLSLRNLPCHWALGAKASSPTGVAAFKRNCRLSIRNRFNQHFSVDIPCSCLLSCGCTSCRATRPR